MLNWNQILCVIIDLLLPQTYQKFTDFNLENDKTSVNW